MSFFFKTKQRDELAVIFDIGSASVGGSLTIFSQNKKPYVVYTTRAQMGNGGKPSPKKIVSLMLGALETVSGKIAKDGFVHLKKVGHAPHKIKRAFYFFSSPWEVSKTNIVKIEKKDPMRLTRGLLDKIISDEEKNFEKALSSGVYGDIFHGDVKIMEKKIIQTKLNGYETADPFNKKVKNFEISLFMSFVPENLISMVESSVRKYFHIKKSQFHSFTLATYRAIGDIFPDEHNFLMMDITGEVTDISLVRKSLIFETLSFPIGRNFFIRKVAEEFGVESDIALSFIKLHTEGRADKALALRLAKTFESMGKEWGDFFFRSIEMISQSLTPPSRLFLTADSDIAPVFTDLASREKIGTDGEAKKPMNVVVLDSEKLSHFCDTDPLTQNDSFLAINNIFLNNLFHSS